jgi:hypothetical protein
MLLIGRGDAEAKALVEWREAASLVSIRWAVFLEAESESRRWAFASYVAALDAEEAAAGAVEDCVAFDRRPAASGVSRRAA